LNNEWKKYRKTAIQEMRDYIPGEDLTGVSITPGETPAEGGKIARDNHGSMWYITPEFFSDSYVLVDEEGSNTPSNSCSVRYSAIHGYML
jgi:hypothetical protein